jgi:hypothetical protein
MDMGQLAIQLVEELRTLSNAGLLRSALSEKPKAGGTESAWGRCFQTLSVMEGSDAQG